VTNSAERRRTPRFATAPLTQVKLSVVSASQILEVSEAGMLLACDRRLSVEDTTQVHTTLGGKPFSAWIKVRRVHAIGSTSSQAHRRYLVGGTFVSLNTASAGVLRGFLLRQNAN
jgi:hypothetical protein